MQIPRQILWLLVATLSFFSLSCAQAPAKKEEAKLEILKANYRVTDMLNEKTLRVTWFYSQNLVIKVQNDGVPYEEEIYNNLRTGRRVENLHKNTYAIEMFDTPLTAMQHGDFKTGEIQIFEKGGDNPFASGVITVQCEWNGNMRILHFEAFGNKLRVQKIITYTANLQLPEKVEVKNFNNMSLVSHFIFVRE